VVGHENSVSLNADKGVAAAHVLPRVEGAEVNLGVYSFARRFRADQVVAFLELEPTNLRTIACEGHKLPERQDAPGVSPGRSAITARLRIE
jgi:hypothetical protein